MAATTLIAACSEKDPLLPGKREGIRSVLSEEDAAADTAIASGSGENITAPVRLAAMSTNSDWTQRIGTPATRTDHPALAASPQLIWSAPIGAGDTSRARITADPVVAGGRVFAMDSQARVTAVSTGGQTLWTRDLVPPNDSATDASGGGLAFGDGKLFVSSGFGFISALNPATGEVLWTQELRNTGTATPAVYGDLVYVVAGDEVAWALDTENGRIQWRLSATPNVNNVIGGPAPAITDKYAVFAFGTGELQGAFRRGGLRLWDAQVAGKRDGLAQSSVTGVTGDPVIVGDRIYVGTHSGRTVALQLANGARIWTSGEGALSPIWPAGDALFLVSDKSELVRLRAEDGTSVWRTKLPFFTKDRPRRQAEVYAHYGPVLAGGQLIVASNDGQLRMFDPESGALRGNVAVPGGATTNPVVAGRTLFVVSATGQLHAFR